MSVWDRVEQTVREVLLAVTRPLPDPVDGFIFGAALITADNLMRVFR